MCTRARSFVVSSLAATALLIAPLRASAAGPADDAAESAPAEGEQQPAEGAEGEGEPAEGEAADGEQPAEGEGAEGAEGEGAEAEGAEGEGAEGEGAEGEEAAAEGEGAEGEAAAEGEEAAAEGEEAAAEGEEATTEPPPPELAVNPEDGRPDEPRIAGKPRTGKGLMIAGGVVLGAGIAATVTFSMITVGCSLDGPLQCKHEDQDDFLIPLGAATTLLGAIILGVGVGYHLNYRKWQNWKPGQDKKRKTAGMFVPTASRSGAGLGYVGRF
jgi:hypothetical protein